MEDKSHNIKFEFIDRELGGCFWNSGGCLLYSTLHLARGLSFGSWESTSDKTVSKTTGTEDDYESTQGSSRQERTDQEPTQTTGRRQGNDPEAIQATGRRQGNDPESMQATDKRQGNDPEAIQATSRQKGNDLQPTKTTGRRPGRPSSNLTPRQRQEHSRRTARACRTRKKIRYQYLVEMVKAKENSVFVLRKEFNKQKEWCKTLDQGEVPKGLIEEIGLDRIERLKKERQKPGDTNDLTEKANVVSESKNSTLTASSEKGNKSKLFYLLTRGKTPKATEFDDSLASSSVLVSKHPISQTLSSFSTENTATSIETAANAIESTVGYQTSSTGADVRPKESTGNPISFIETHVVGKESIQGDRKSTLYRLLTSPETKIKPVCDDMVSFPNIGMSGKKASSDNRESGEPLVEHPSCPPAVEKDLFHEKSPGSSTDMEFFDWLLQNESNLVMNSTPDSYAEIQIPSETSKRSDNPATAVCIDAEAMSTLSLYTEVSRCDEQVSFSDGNRSMSGQYLAPIYNKLLSPSFPDKSNTSVDSGWWSNMGRERTRISHYHQPDTQTSLDFTHPQPDTQASLDFTNPQPNTQTSLDFTQPQPDTQTSLDFTHPQPDTQNSLDFTHPLPETQIQTNLDFTHPHHTIHYRSQRSISYPCEFTRHFSPLSFHQSNYPSGHLVRRCNQELLIDLLVTRM